MEILYNLFDKCCKAWTIAIRNMLYLPYNIIMLLLKVNTSNDNIGMACIHTDMYYSNRCTGYNIVFLSF